MLSLFFGRGNRISICRIFACLCSGCAPRAYAWFFKKAQPWIFGAYAETESDRFAYDALNVYVFAKLGWNPSLDVDALIAD